MVNGGNHICAAVHPARGVDNPGQGATGPVFCYSDPDTVLYDALMLPLLPCTRGWAGTREPRPSRTASHTLWPSILDDRK